MPDQGSPEGLGRALEMLPSRTALPGSRLGPRGGQTRGQATELPAFGFKHVGPLLDRNAHKLQRSHGAGAPAQPSPYGGPRSRPAQTPPPPGPAPAAQLYGEAAPPYGGPARSRTAARGRGGQSRASRAAGSHHGRRRAARGLLGGLLPPTRGPGGGQAARAVPRGGDLPVHREGAGLRVRPGAETANRERQGRGRSRGAAWGGAACREAGLRIVPRGRRVGGVCWEETSPCVLCLPDVQAVYTFPGQVWHLEVLALRRALYVLCARRGIYCLSLDQTR